MNFETQPDQYGRPHLLIAVEGQPTDLNWENTSLFTHAEQYANINHIFIQIDEEDNQGFFVFREMIPEHFDNLFNALKDADYQHIHMPEPHERDVEQYHLVMAKLGAKATQEVVVIEEVEDEQVVQDAIRYFDEEWKWYSGESEWNV